MTITPQSLANLTEEELRRRLAEAERRLADLTDNIPRQAVASARSSGVDMYPVRQALESFGLSAPGRTKVTFTVSVPIAITAYLADGVDPDHVDAGWIEDSLSVEEYQIMDHIRDYDRIALDGDWDTGEIEWDYESVTVTDYTTTTTED